MSFCLSVCQSVSFVLVHAHMYLSLRSSLYVSLCSSLPLFFVCNVLLTTATKETVVSMNQETKEGQSIHRSTEREQRNINRSRDANTKSNFEPQRDTKIIVQTPRVKHTQDMCREKPYNELFHVTDDLQARQSEPYTRGALKGVHSAPVFLEEVAGILAPERLSRNQLFMVIFKELSSGAAARRLAPTMLTTMLSKIEGIVVEIPRLQRTTGSTPGGYW